MNKATLIRVCEQVTEDSLKVMHAVPIDYWYGDNDGFTAGDTVAHLVQATKFFASFVFPQAGVGEPFFLHPSFGPIVSATGEERHELISRANLTNARKLRDKHDDPVSLIELYASARKSVVEVELLDQVQARDYGRHVSHPLVMWAGSFEEMFVHLFVVHDAEHRGNITATMRFFGATVPFHSGKIPD
jgi:hypothetical protein